MLIRTSASPNDEFLVVDAITNKVLAGPFGSLADAIRAAEMRAQTPLTIWQQNTDHRGRPFGPAMRIDLHSLRGSLADRRFA